MLAHQILGSGDVIIAALALIGGGFVGRANRNEQTVSNCARCQSRSSAIAPRRLSLSRSKDIGGLRRSA